MELTKKDIQRMKGVHPALVRLFTEVARTSPIPFMILEGRRSLEQQKKNIENGVSWTLKSKHLTGHALDVIPLVEGKPTWSWPVYHKFAPIVKAVAKKLKIEVTWGGDWKKTKDGPHWEIDPKKYGDANV